MINVALLSKWHVHANDYAKQATENLDLSVKVVWDEDEIRGEEWANSLGVPFEKDLYTVLTSPEIDAVIVDTPTSQHKDVIIAAAQNNKHIFTEKVLAFTLKECEEIYAAVESADVKLMASLPRLTESYYLYAQDVVDQGYLGTLTTIRCRLAHNGAVPSEGQSQGWLPEHFFNQEETGGGALIDLGAHPIYLTNRLGGAAASVSARLQSTINDRVDDNAVVIVEYESGALGIIESGFVAYGSPFQLELYGTEGTLLIEDDAIRLKSKQLEATAWITPEKLPQPLPMALEQWVEMITGNKTPAITKKDLCNLTLINQAAALSQKDGRKVEIEEVNN